MKRIGLLLLVAFFFSFLPAFADNGTSIVKFGDLHGEVNVRPNTEDDDAYIFAELDTPLHHDDRIKTLTRSGAILSFSDMSTFVMKEDTTIVLDIANEKQSKIGLLAGNVWVNLKKMASDGSLEVEMGQAVAGLKGTNITCSTNQGEDRIQVLRGIARVLIKESKETIEVKEGEELVVKKGAKPEKKEIDVAAEQKKWEEDTSRLGESIQMNEIPDVLKGILESETAEFTRINEAFTRMLAQTTVEAAEVMELQKDAERFLGIILEDNLILGSMRKKVDLAMQTPGLPAADAVQMASLLREIAAVLSRIQSNQAQAGKIMRYQFKLSALINEEIQADIELVRTELAQAVSEVDAIRAVISANPSGQSQDWFMESVEVCAMALSSLEIITEKVAALIAENPTSVEAQALSKMIADQQIAISTLMRSLAVVEIDSATITEMSQIDDTLSDQIVVLQHEISAYNSLTDATVAEKESRFVSSVKIMSNFAKVRRQYTNAQRLYETTAKATSSSKFRTAEMEEVESVYSRITDNFQQLGIVAEELELNIRDLESQLSTYLK
jgi:hypothetical protein